MFLNANANGMTEHENGEKSDRGAGLFEGWIKERWSGGSEK